MFPKVVEQIKAACWLIYAINHNYLDNYFNFQVYKGNRDNLKTLMIKMDASTDFNLSTSAAPIFSEFVSSQSDYLVENFTNFLTTSTTCDPDSHGCEIDHTKVCVGDALYCNLTEEEYRELLISYITPSWTEWILIFSHIVVFFLGVVSSNRGVMCCEWVRNWNQIVKCEHFIDGWLMNGHWTRINYFHAHNFSTLHIFTLVKTNYISIYI